MDLDQALHACLSIEQGLVHGRLQPIPVTVNRPFMFLIRDTATGTVLFLGRVMNPDPVGDNEEK